MRRKNFFYSLLFLSLILACLSDIALAAIIDDAADLPTQQAQEKLELEEMRTELKDIRSNMTEAQEGMEQLAASIANSKTHEINLTAQETSQEVVPGIVNAALTYNAHIPGPTIRIREGERVKLVLYNKLKTATSLYLHGLPLPHSLNGLPRHGQGLVQPGESYIFEFRASQPGTFWYHPQVMHANQVVRGLYGALVVEPSRTPKTYENDVVLFLGEAHISKTPKTAGTASSSQNLSKEAVYYTINGKSAPAIAPLEVSKNERIRLRVINTTQQVCPLHLTGHHFEVVATNGSNGDGLKPRITRDTIALAPYDRVDLEFTANNPGVWSLACLLPAQSTNEGKFPGGIALVVRYK